MTKALEKVAMEARRVWSTVPEWYLNPAHMSFYGMEVERAMDAFLYPLTDGTPNVRMPYEAMPFFTEWFAFQFVLYGKQTIMAHYTETNPATIPTARLSVLREMQRTFVCDVFEIVHVLPSGMYEVVQLRTAEPFSVYITEGAFAPGDVCMMSIVSYMGMQVALSAPVLFTMSRAEVLVIVHSVPKFSAMDMYYFDALPDDVEGPDTDEEIAMQHVVEEMEKNPHTFTEPCANTREISCGTCVLCRFNELLALRGIAEDDELSCFTPDLDENGRVICGVFVGEGCLTCAVCKLVNKSENETYIPDSAEVTEVTNYAQEKEERVFLFPEAIAEKKVSKKEKKK